VVACHVRPVDQPAGPRPGGPVQPRRWPAARERGARAGRARGVVTAWWPRARRRDGSTCSGGQGVLETAA
jgi:hypothetical protein